MRTQRALRTGWLCAAVAVGAAATDSTTAAQSTSAPTAVAPIAGTWNTFRADITIRHTRVTADGTSAGEAAPTLEYLWVRRLTSAGWRTRMTLVNAARPVVQTASGAKTLDDPFAIARIEDDEDGTPLRVFNRQGEQMAFADQANDGPPGTAPGTGTAAMRSIGFGRDWIDGIVAPASAIGKRQAALLRRLGTPTGRVGGRDRFVVPRGDDTVEVLTDPVWALPVEVNIVRSGALVSHTTLTYAPGASGTVVRRSLHIEHALSDLDGARLATDVEFANVRTEERR